MGVASDIYEEILADIGRRESELDEYKALAVYADPHDRTRLLQYADNTRQVLAGLDIARTIALRHVINEKDFV